VAHINLCALRDQMKCCIQAIRHLGYICRLHKLIIPALSWRCEGHSKLLCDMMVCIAFFIWQTFPFAWMDRLHAHHSSHRKAVYRNAASIHTQKTTIHAQQHVGYLACNKTLQLLILETLIYSQQSPFRILQK